jgi:ankyrin repeat protein
MLFFYIIVLASMVVLWLDTFLLAEAAEVIATARLVAGHCIGDKSHAIELQMKQCLSLNDLEDVNGTNERKLTLGVTTKVAINNEELDMNAQAKTVLANLMSAARYGQNGDIDSLLSNGVSVNLQDEYGKTAIMWAAEYGQEETIKILLEWGANLNEQKTKAGLTALMLASRNGHTKIVQILADRGADIDLNIRDLKGYTALMWAAWYGNEAIVQALVTKGADLNIVNNDGYTALMKAAGADHVNVSRLLIDSGAGLNIRNNRGNTALAIAKGRSKDILEKEKAKL